MDKRPTECPACGETKVKDIFSDIIYFECDMKYVLNDGVWVVALDEDYEKYTCSRAFDVAVSLRTAAQPQTDEGQGDVFLEEIPEPALLEAETIAKLNAFRDEFWDFIASEDVDTEEAGYVLTTDILPRLSDFINTLSASPAPLTGDVLIDDVRLPRMPLKVRPLALPADVQAVVDAAMAWQEEMQQAYTQLDGNKDLMESEQVLDRAVTALSEKGGAE